MPLDVVQYRVTNYTQAATDADGNPIDPASCAFIMQQDEYRCLQRNDDGSLSATYGPWQAAPVIYTTAPPGSVPQDV